MKLLLEIAGTMEWKIVGLFDSYDEINQWIEEEYDISYEQWLLGIKYHLCHLCQLQSLLVLDF